MKNKQKINNIKMGGKYMRQVRDKKTTAIIILIIVIIITAGYIGLQKYQQYTQQKQLTVFQQGAQYGYQQAIIQVAQQAATCQAVPLQIQDQTLNIIAVDCLQR